MADYQKTEGPLTKEQVQALVGAQITQAEQYNDDDLEPHRALATQYYKGRPFGNEEDGRSQVVLTEVRDAILGILPSMLRVLFGAEHPVEVVPSSAESQAAAAQATAFLRKEFIRVGGFMQTFSVLKDGLTRRWGVFKAGWDETVETSEHTVTTSSDELALVLQEDPTLTLVGEEPAGTPGLFQYTLQRTTPNGRVWVRSLPLEEFLISRNARSIEEADFVGHAMELTASELRLLGVSEEDLVQYGSSELEDSEGAIARSNSGYIDDAEEAGAANRKIRYVEAYLRLDVDGDGIAEERLICTLGTGNQVVRNERIDERPFFGWCPDPEPHALMDGQSVADRTMDIQRTKSAVFRAQLDSLAAAIFPRLAYVDGQVNIQDLLNTAIGAPIRMRSVGTLQPVEIPFVGEKAMPVLAYLDEIVERRTGQNKGTLGLDADALQSTTKSAADAAVTSSQMQSELLVRLFLEQAFKPLFRYLYRCFVKHQPRARMERIAGAWVPVDPRYWDADADVEIVVALGASSTERKLAALETIAAKQEQAMQLLGPQNLLVSLVEYRNTLAKASELLGYPDSALFFKPVSEEQLQQAAQAAAAQPPQPTPEQILAQAQLEIEKMKAEKDIAIKGEQLNADIAVKERELSLKERELAIKEQDLLLKAREVSLREYEAESRLDLEATRLETEAELRQEQMVTQARTERERLESQEGIAELTASTQLAQGEAQVAVQREGDAHKVGLEREKLAQSREVLHAAERGKRAAQEAKAPPARPAQKIKLRLVRDDNGKVTGIEEE